MSDFGKIHRGFHRHPKAIAAGNAALGLWARANSWCRDQRQAGYIPEGDALELGTREEIDALVRERLWVKTAHGYKFKDYEYWNDDVEPDTVAGALVRETVPEAHPSAIRKQLTRQAAALLSEGIDREIVQRALAIWCEKDLNPSLLPALASEAMKEAQRKQSLLNVMRDCYRMGVVTPLKPFGHVFTPPDIPANLIGDARREFVRRAMREWLVDLQKRIK